MQTDIPLKVLTQQRAQDLLPLLGVADATVRQVIVAELPASAKRLDMLLELERADGTTALHLIEWQGYRDVAFLWRVAGYLSWLGVERPGTPLAITLVYLTPNDDVGTLLTSGPPDARGKWHSRQCGCGSSMQCRRRPGRLVWQSSAR